MTKLTPWLLALLSAFLLVQNWLQQTAIENILLTQTTETAWFAATSAQIAEFQRFDEDQLLIVTNHEERLQFVEKQCDVLVAASRSGKNGFKVIAAYEETTK